MTAPENPRPGYHYVEGHWRQNPSVQPDPVMPVSPVPGYAPAVAQRTTSTLATMAMVFAVLGVVGSCCTFGVFSVVSIILGHLAWKETHSGQKGGHGMTVASLVISYIMLIPAIFLTISFGISAATSAGS